MEKYDLTDAKELQKVMTDVLLMPFPWLRLAKYVFDKMTGSDATKVQSEVAQRLIEKGKENGVDNMEIKMNNTKGFKLNMPLDEKIKIDTMIGSDEKMTVRVKYKK